MKKTDSQAFPSALNEPDEGFPVDADAFRKLAEHIRQLPEMDATRVVNLHNRVLAGDYDIDSPQVAAKLLELESSLDD